MLVSLLRVGPVQLLSLLLIVSLVLCKWWAVDVEVAWDARGIAHDDALFVADCVYDETIPELFAASIKSDEFVWIVLPVSSCNPITCFILLVLLLLFTILCSFAALLIPTYVSPSSITAVYTVCSVLPAGKLLLTNLSSSRSKCGSAMSKTENGVGRIKFARCKWKRLAVLWSFCPLLASATVLIVSGALTAVECNCYYNYCYYYYTFYSSWSFSSYYYTNLDC